MLSFPELTGARATVLEVLATVSARDDAAMTLGVPDTLSDQVRRNTRWRSEPAVPVSSLYTGVLYDALGLPGLPVGARRRAARRLLVVSAAWGLLRPGDRVPPYRLSMDATLPGTGPLASFWRPRLEEVLPVLDDGLVVDCRSQTYAAAWRPTGAVAERSVTVSVLRDTGGRRSVVSHLAKHTRGLVARHLVTRDGRDPRTATSLAAALGEAFEVELSAPARDGSRRIDIVLTDPAPPA